MGSSEHVPGFASPPKPQSDYTRPIARSGEQQFACIMRQRSGESSGRIDMGVRDVTPFPDDDQQDAVDSAYAIYETLCDQTGKRAKRDEA